MPSEGEKNRDFFSEMERREAEHLEKAEEIHAEIEAIERASQVELSALAKGHNHLRMKYIWYYRWHLNRWANLTHYCLLILFCLLVLALIAIVK